MYCLLRGIFLYCVLCQVYCIEKIPCSFEDQKCVTEAARIKYPGFAAGIPSIGLESSDPLNTPLIRQTLPNIHYQLSNAYLYGLGNCTVGSYQIFLQQQYSVSQFNCPRLVMESDCEVYGHLGYLYTHGKGACRIIHNNITIGVYSNVNFRVNENGQIFMHLVRSLYGFDVKGGIEYDLRKLYNGNQELSSSASQYATKHWRLLFETIQVPMLQQFMDIWVRNANVYFAHYSANDVFSLLVPN